MKHVTLIVLAFFTALAFAPAHAAEPSVGLCDDLWDAVVALSLLSVGALIVILSACVWCIVDKRRRSFYGDQP